MNEVSARLYYLTRTMSLQEALDHLKEKNHPSKVWEWPINLVKFSLTEGEKFFASRASEEEK